MLAVHESCSHRNHHVEPPESAACLFEPTTPMNACALLPRGGAPSFRLARGGAQATSTLRTALRSTVAIHTHTRGHHATHYYSLPSTVTSSKPHLRLIARPILRSTRTMSSSTEAQSFYDLKADLPKEGEVLDLSSLKGKVVLVVNVASKWCVYAHSCVLDGVLLTAG